MLLALGATPPPKDAGSPTPPAALASFRQQLAQARADNRRLSDELALIACVAPEKRGWWDEHLELIVSTVLSLGIGLAAGPLVSYLFARRQQRDAFTNELLLN